MIMIYYYDCMVWIETKIPLTTVYYDSRSYYKCFIFKSNVHPILRSPRILMNILNKGIYINLQQRFELKIDECTSVSCYTVLI
jgi:hypothetical protein